MTFLNVIAKRCRKRQTLFLKKILIPFKKQISSLSKVGETEE